jgi:hypothetical protein
MSFFILKLGGDKQNSIFENNFCTVISVARTSGATLVSLYNLGYLILGLQLSFILIMEVIVEGLVCSSEMLITTFKTIQNLNPEDHSSQLTLL